MEIERRALYNLLRINWLLNPKSVHVEAWQVADYRSASKEDLFEQLLKLGVNLDKATFIAYADHVDTPEELADELIEDIDSENHAVDKLYLLIFELWRRFLPEKESLSIFCDELDHQIYLYDNGLSESPEGIQDAIANLQVILDENTDNGVEPEEAFQSISAGCANDIETFLYDYIVEQLENNNYAYAQELLDGFSDYVSEVHWFELLRAQLLAVNDPNGANRLIQHLMKEFEGDVDLEFTLEALSFLVKEGQGELFTKLAKKAIQQLEFEEEFQDLLSICVDYYHRLDDEKKENQMQAILNTRSQYSLDAKIAHDDAKIGEFLKTIK